MELVIFQHHNTLTTLWFLTANNVLSQPFDLDFLRDCFEAGWRVVDVLPHLYASVSKQAQLSLIDLDRYFQFHFSTWRVPLSILGTPVL